MFIYFIYIYLYIYIYILSLTNSDLAVFALPVRALAPIAVFAQFNLGLQSLVWDTCVFCLKFRFVQCLLCIIFWCYQGV